LDLAKINWEQSEPIYKQKSNENHHH